MSFEVKIIAVFERQAKRLIKKFPSLKKEIKELVDQLKVEPEKGTPIGHDCYKIRIAIASKGRGKSGGGRIITHVYFTENELYLLAIYDKSEIDNLADKDILALVQQIPK